MSQDGLFAVAMPSVAGELTANKWSVSKAMVDWTHAVRPLSLKQKIVNSIFKADEMKTINTTCAALVMVLAVGCNDPSIENPGNPDAGAKTSNSITASSLPGTNSQGLRTVIQPSPTAQTELQEALILAEPGELIELGEGTFNFDGTLSIDGINNVTICGQGMEKTILNFANVRAGKGGEGLKVKANDFTIEDVTIEDTPGDAIKFQDCSGLTIRRVRTWWSRGPATENGAYGLYPVLSTNVLIEHCVAEGASDAGIYVGQSKQVVVRNCRAERNVAGIEIENCIGADVYDNVANNNTGGILVFSLPGLTIKNGSDCRVFNNQMLSNNHENFAETGAIVSTVPPGTGLMIMANDRVEVFGNTFEKNNNASCLIVSFLVSQRKYDDALYDPYPESIHIHNNTFKDGGSVASGEFLKIYAESTGNEVPDIVFDGIVDESKWTNGAIPKELNFSIKDNGDASYVNLDMARMLSGQAPVYNSDLKPFAKPLPPVQPVVIPGVE